MKHFKVGDRVRMYVTVDARTGITPTGIVVEVANCSPKYDRLKVKVDMHSAFFEPHRWVYSKQCRKLKEKR